jgi:hypothetical protein
MNRTYEDTSHPDKIIFYLNQARYTFLAFFSVNYASDPPKSKPELAQPENTRRLAQLDFDRLTLKNIIAISCWPYASGHDDDHFHEEKVEPVGF